LIRSILRRPSVLGRLQLLSASAIRSTPFVLMVRLGAAFCHGPAPDEHDRLTAWVPLAPGGFLCSRTAPLRCPMRDGLPSLGSASWRIGKLSSFLLGGSDLPRFARQAVFPMNLELRLAPFHFHALPELLSAVSLTPCRQRAYRDPQQSFLNGRFVGTGPYQPHLLSNGPQASGSALRQTTGGQAPANWAGIGHGQPQPNSTGPCMAPMRSGEVDCALHQGPLRATSKALPWHRSAAEGRLHEGGGSACSISYLTLLSRPAAPGDNPAGAPRPGPQASIAALYQRSASATACRPAACGQLSRPSLRVSDPR